MTKIDKERYIDVGAIDRTATTEYNSYSLDLAAQYSYAPITIAGLRSDLALSFGLNFNMQESYRETGADSLNLSVDAKHSVKAEAGIENIFYWQNKSESTAQFLPFLSTGLFASRHLTSTDISQAFAGGSKVKIVTDRDQDVYGEIGLGFVNIEEDSDELRLLTKAKFSDKVTEYSASLDYNMNF